MTYQPERSSTPGGKEFNTYHLVSGPRGEGSWNSDVRPSAIRHPGLAASQTDFPVLYSGQAVRGVCFALCSLDTRREGVRMVPRSERGGWRNHGRTQMFAQRRFDIPTYRPQVDFPWCHHGGGRERTVNRCGGPVDTPQLRRESGT